MSLPSRIAAGLLAAFALSALAAGGVGVGVGAQAAIVGDCTPGSDWGTPRDDLASQTVSLVNAHRASLGLSQLAVSPTLAASAYWKARHMAEYGYMAHNDPAPPVGRTTGDRMQTCGYTASWGENIAAGYPTAQQVFQGWLNSPGHKSNMENPAWRAMGAGAAAADDGYMFWANTFGTVADGGAPPRRPRLRRPRRHQARRLRHRLLRLPRRAHRRHRHQRRRLRLPRARRLRPVRRRLRLRPAHHLRHRRRRLRPRPPVSPRLPSLPSVREPRRPPRRLRWPLRRSSCAASRSRPVSRRPGR